MLIPRNEEEIVFDFVLFIRLFYAYLRFQICCLCFMQTLSTGAAYYASSLLEHVGDCLKLSMGEILRRTPYSISG